MARNQARRRALLDAAIGVLAKSGARGLTHRAVDAEAQVPVGTTSNYFRARGRLIAELFGRIGERLQPDPKLHLELAKRAPTVDLYADYVRDIVARLTRQRDVTIALFELRLEATRNPEVAARLTQWLHSGFTADCEFVRAAGLPGGPREVALFHYAIDGLLLDRLTISIDAETEADEVVHELAHALLTTRKALSRSPKQPPRSAGTVRKRSTNKR